MNLSTQCVYRFGGATVDGDGTLGNLLGGKGAGLAEMTLLSIPVPPGFTITTDVCHSYLAAGTLPAAVSAEIERTLRWLEQQSGKSFGHASNPLLVSVRSGAPISMPGMMDTVLNVGLNDASIQGLAAASGSQVFALDSYRRLLQMFGSVVLDVPKDAFEQAMHNALGEATQERTSDYSEAELLLIVQAYKALIESHTGKPFPQSPMTQLSMAVEAVFRSWQSDRAKFYRKLNKIPETMGTAVTVQAMVFGNRGENSGTGVGFTRNPSTGAAEVFAEYLPNAQGEDIVAGTRTPMPIHELARQQPAVYAELMQVTQRLEDHYKDVQDFEFTVEAGKLYLLQTRSAKRSAQAAVRIAVEMADEGMISREQAVARITPSSLAEILSPQLSKADTLPTPLTTGLAASPGAAVGIIALSANAAVAMHSRGDAVILLTQETTAEDIHGMDASVGFLTARGGATSHAAVVARGMGKCCITGARQIQIDHANGIAHIGDRQFRQGDWLSLDGSTGAVYAGALPLQPASLDHPELDRLLSWARSMSTCKVRANADTPADAKSAIDAGAVGIGLCRTEHMFFAADRLAIVRSMILAQSPADRATALQRLLPIQQSDFEVLLRTMTSLPVTIRLLDPPLHEFLPSLADIDHEIAAARRDENWEEALTLQRTRKQVETLTESNPMMGHRGCRLSLTYPEILTMQVKAILQAALTVINEGFHPHPEIMVPLVSSEQEMKVLAALIHEAAEEVFTSFSQRVDYTIGTMIELPRAAVCAAAIARHVSFMSFGTNDLTQMTYGASRDDARTYLDSYLEQGIFTVDPFITIDREGVGWLMALAIQSVRELYPAMKIGICGEHGGDPKSIEFFCTLDIDYVSCSPSRLQVAQLAVAQSTKQTEATPAENRLTTENVFEIVNAA